MKKIIWISVFICSILFGFIPTIWGGSSFSLEGVIFNGLGGLFGIWIGYKMYQS